MTATQSISKNKGGRLLALDILRGITIAGMILVNNPGTWSDIYAPLRHAEWHGLTPTDLVFPFFMFIMGVSTYFSLRKYDFSFTWPTLAKILRRTVVISSSDSPWHGSAGFSADCAIPTCRLPTPCSISATYASSG